jgi:hypothetical protein
MTPRQQALWTDAAFGPQSAFLIVALADGTLLPPAAAESLGYSLAKPRTPLLRRVLDATPVPQPDRFDRLGTDADLRARSLMALREVFWADPEGEAALDELMELLTKAVEAAGKGDSVVHRKALARVRKVLSPTIGAESWLVLIAVLAVVVGVVLCIAWSF